MNPKERIRPAATPEPQQDPAPAPVDEDFAQLLKCAVCFDILGTPVYQGLPCSQKYCETCIKQWRYTHFNRTCPLCRKPAYRITRDHFVDRMVDKYYKLNPGAAKREPCPPWDGPEISGSSDSDDSDVDEDSNISFSDEEIEVVNVIPRRVRFEGVEDATRDQAPEARPIRQAAALAELQILNVSIDRNIGSLANTAETEDMALRRRPPAAAINERAVQLELMDVDDNVPPVLGGVLDRPRRAANNSAPPQIPRPIYRQLRSRRERTREAQRISARIQAQIGEMITRTEELVRRNALVRPAGAIQVVAHPAQPDQVPETGGNNQMVPRGNRQQARGRTQQQLAPVIRHSARLRDRRAP